MAGSGKSAYWEPGKVTAIYAIASAGFCVATFSLHGPRFPSSALFVNFLTGAALSWTLDVLVRYARDTGTVAASSVEQAKAANQQIETARQERERVEKSIFAGVAVLLLDFLRVESLYADRSPQERDRERWKIQTDVSRAIMAIESKALVPVCAEILELVTFANAATDREEILDLAGKAATLAHPEIFAEYFRRTKVRDSMPPSDPPEPPQQVGGSSLISSADLTLRLEDRFSSISFGRRRREAAVAIGTGNMFGAEPILEFFETIGLLTRRGVLDLEFVYSTFSWWERRYFEVMRDHVIARRSADITLWTDVLWLDGRFQELQVRKGLKPEAMGPKEITEFLTDEEKQGGS